jgi:excisionase family DNA binding protein
LPFANRASNSGPPTSSETLAAKKLAGNLIAASSIFGQMRVQWMTGVKNDISKGGREVRMWKIHVLPRHSIIQTSRSISVRHVAKRLNIPERSVRHLAARGKLPAYKLGKLWKFRVAEIEDLCTQKEAYG